ncbi:MAG TPA: tRNA (cytidine(34)-2'-O)-methyltransferase [Hyphomicrobiales bacterium]|nr:tRNA (cytidine(34)-2'-O)-methyltransferase [Hyphomicrobiales bacterium]
MPRGYGAAFFNYCLRITVFNIVLFEPEIPPNTGNIIRLAANSGCALHLIEPLGFTLEERSLRRAGLDYHEYARVRVHADWQAFMAALQPRRIFAFSTHGTATHAGQRFEPGDCLLFGPESRGLPPSLRQGKEITAVLRLPMMPDNRSINLSNAVAVAVYEAWRQQGFTGAEAEGLT